MGAQGTKLLDFGAFPGASDASVAVTGQAGIGAASLVEAWLRPEATADHTADEHMVETVKAVAGNIVAGTGFTIYGFNTGQITEPLVRVGVGRNGSVNGAPSGLIAGENSDASVGGQGTRIYGKWTVAWVWN
jgi:hypothetical protein